MLLYMYYDSVIELDHTKLCCCILVFSVLKSRLRYRQVFHTRNYLSVIFKHTCCVHVYWQCAYYSYCFPITVLIVVYMSWESSLYTLSKNAYTVLYTDMSNTKCLYGDGVIDYSWRIVIAIDIYMQESIRYYCNTSLIG